MPRRVPAPELVGIRRVMPSVFARRDQNRTPAPEIVVGQPRATPPAIDRVMAAEIFLVGEDGFAEFGQR